MFYFDRFILSFLSSFNKFISKKYVIGENHFIRNRKMTLKDIIIYVLVNKGRTNYIEAVEFYSKLLNNDLDTITPQAIGKQRQYLDSKIFINMSNSFIDELYNKFKGFSTFKGYIVLACDGSIFDLPNTNSIRKEFKIPKKDEFMYKNTRARVSCMLDVNSGFILTSKIVNKSINEIKLALMHLENLNSRLDLKRVITIYDRGYNSIELMVKTDDLGSKYIIRLKKVTFHHEIKKLNSDDGIIEININRTKLQGFKDEELKEKLKKQGRIKIRIVKVKLKTGEVEILATNLPQEKFTSEELKELYKQRWEIETGYDKLKNLIQIEEFTGIREIIIKQDFYANIFIYNLITAIKIDSEKRITRETRNKAHLIKYKINFAKLTGMVYIYIYDLFVKNRTKKSIILEFIIESCSKTLTQENLSKNRKKERKAQDVNNKHPGNKKRTH